MSEKLDLEPLDLEPIEEELSLEPITPIVPPKPSVLESTVGGIQQGATFGLSEELGGLMEAGFSGTNALLNKVGLGMDTTYDPNLVDVYTQSRDEGRARLKALEAANPKAYMAGEIGASLAIPGKGVGQLAAQGALSGFGTAEGDFQKQVAGTLGGATLGAAGAGVSKVAGSSIEALTPLYNKIKEKVGLEAAQKWLETQAGKMAEKAAGFDLSVSSREKMANMLRKGKVDEGEIGKKLLEENIVTKEASAGTIAKRVNAAREEAGQKIGNIVNESPNIDPRQVAAQLEGRANTISTQGPQGDLRNSLLNESKKFGNLEDVGPQSMPMSELQTSKQMYGEKADWSKPMTDVNAMANRELDDLIKAGMPADKAEAYLSANRDYSLLGPTAKIAEKNESVLSGRNILSVGALPAIGAAGGYNEGGALGGLAGAVAFRTAQKRGPQILASGVWDFAKLIEKAPDRLKGVLQKALERGGHSPAATHYLLQQQDPEYQTATTEEE